ncbi:hypothetical protein [Arthrobacter sp. Ld5]|uniref:hypothetical protein n=1 Tax=Arthrobacter sp. Ld5 TaxID=649152 RepID=UPI003EBA30C8
MTAPAALSGREPQSPEGQEFARRFAEITNGWRIPGAGPDAFDLVGGLIPLVIVLQVPGVVVPHNQCTLQIAYWPDRAGAPLVSGEWGDDHLLEGQGQDEGDLLIGGVALSPTECAEKAAAWIEDQLHRPLVREDWTRKGKVIKSKWILDDTKTVIVSHHEISMSIGSLERRTTRLR